MVRVQKGAVLYEHGRKRATIVAAIALACVPLFTSPARADLARSVPLDASAPVEAAGASTLPAPAADPSGAATPPSNARPLRSVTLFMDGASSTFATTASTVGEFLAERGIVPTSQDAVSDPLGRPLRAGMNVAFRRAVPVTIVDGRSVRSVHTSIQLVREVLLANRASLGPGDEVSPVGSSRVEAGETITITHVSRWTTHLRQDVPVKVLVRYDRDLATGTVRTANAGRTGVREIATSFERRGEIARQTALVSRIVRRPQDRVMVHGIGRFTSLAHLAKTGFDATVAFAGQAISMIATAYTAACYGCSGITASGAHAGHGIVAVDPSVIPLGTRLFIPGYGHAVAGDTGGAIVGRRIDLGFDRAGDALEFGRRPITVYVLKR